mmetsp:Transcript_74632/g.207453  ORF Transcript_74632/g.207453 Transcript_74632/m.207453 type:complete len:468 (+) Transcript_74632:152-1555(+)
MGDARRPPLVVGLILCASILPVAAAVSAEGTRHAGFLALASGTGLSRDGGGAESFLQQSPAQSFVPRLPNDTITPEYLRMVDAAIAAAQRTTTSVMRVAPQNLQGTVVSGVSTTYPVPIQAAWIKDRASLEPIDMRLGAKVVAALTWTSRRGQGGDGTQPSQKIVTQQMVAQCPLIMLGSAVDITAPKCGALGQWTDPLNQRTVLRWEPRSGGGVRYGVDSVVGGNGSMTFATFTQKFSLSGISFALSNCLDVMRYTVEETIMKVDQIGHGVQSSIQAHEVKSTGSALFYKYTIVAPNGTAVAETTLYRQNQNSINITMVDSEVAGGAAVAVAKRFGTWTGSGWGECSGTKRGWTVDFMLSDRDSETANTVMDLRVATAAVVTLMAYRDQNVGEGVISRDGEHDMLRQLLWMCLVVLIVLALLFLCTLLCKRKGWDARARRLCFRFEAALLPKRPLCQRQPMVPTTW